MTSRLWITYTISLLAIAGFGSPAIAQIVPDESLGVERSRLNQRVNVNGRRIDQIEGGAQRGRHLFHSFQEFNVGDRQRVYFTNPSGIHTIVGRVTGANASTILGTLGVLGDANLFLMNPNGLIFGPSAQLDLRGSFVGTTADRLVFGPNLSFSASQPQAPPLLTLEVPIGLQFGADPAAILNLGNLEGAQDLVLAGGGVVSTGQLIAPQGTVAIATPSSRSQTLSQLDQPLTLMPVDPRLSPRSQASPYLITTSGLIPLTDLPTVAAGDVEIQGVNAQTAILSAGQDLRLLGSQLVTQQDLTLLGQRQVWITDQLDAPVTAIAGGALLIQGRDRIQIQALSDPQSILAAGDALTLQSAAPVLGDGRFFAGGPLRVERLDGSLGILESPDDPVLGSLRDVAFETYIGRSLHILAAGSIRIETVEITGAAQPNQAITAANPYSNVPLADGTTLVVDGSTAPTLDLRAGMDEAEVQNFLNSFAIPLPEGFLGGAVPGLEVCIDCNTVDNLNGRADIILGEVTMLAPDSVVLITNRFQANGNPGNIRLNGPITLFNEDNGGQLVVESRDNLTVMGRINGNLPDGNGVPISLFAEDNLTVAATITSESANNASGTLRLEAGDTLAIGGQTAEGDPIQLSVQGFNDGTGGEISLVAPTVTVTDGAQLNAGTSGSGAGGQISMDALTVTLADGTRVLTGTSGAGAGGQIVITAPTVTLTDGVRLDAGALRRGAAGQISIDALTVLLANGTLLNTATSGAGAAGQISITAPTVTLTNAARLSTSSSGRGNAGQISVEAEQLTLTEGSTIASGTIGTGNAGQVTIDANQVTLQDSGILVSSNRGNGTEAPGAAGQIQIRGETVALVGSSQISASTESDTGGGRIGIRANQINLQDQAALFGGASGNGAGSTIDLQANRIRLSQNAAIEAITTGAGNGATIQLQGDRISLNDQSRIVGDTNGFGTGATVTLRGDRISLSDEALIQVNARNQGAGGQVSLTGDRISLSDQASIQVNAYNRGAGGQVSLTGDRISLSDQSSIQGSSLGRGAGGTIVLNGDQITFSQLGRIEAVAFGRGQGGDVTFNADRVSMIGSIDRVDQRSTGIFVNTDNAALGNAGRVTFNIGTSMDLSRASIFANSNGAGQGGEILIRGGSLTLRNDAQISLRHLSTGGGGQIQLQNMDQVRILGNPNRVLPMGFFLGTEGAGDGANLSLQADRLLIRDGGGIFSPSNLSGNAGDLTFQTRVLEVSGEGIGSPSAIQSVASPGSSGNAGRINIQTDILRVVDGSNISTETGGTGDAGQLNIRAGQVLVTGAGNEGGSAISSSTRFSTGNAGDLSLESDRIEISNGGRILTESTLGSQGQSGNVDVTTGTLLIESGGTLSTQTEVGGRAGNVTVRADEVTVQGDGSQVLLDSRGDGNAGRLSIVSDRLQIQDGGLVSAFTAGAGQGGVLRVATDTLQIQNGTLRFSTEGSGNARGIDVRAQVVNVLDGGRVTVEALSTGLAGDLSLQANQITIAGRSELRAGTRDSQAGTVQLTAQQRLTLDQSRIFSRARGSGDAGGIQIRTSQLDLSQAALTVSANDGSAGALTIDADRWESDRSSLSATTTTGNGGNITLDMTQGVQLQQTRVEASTLSGSGGNVTLRVQRGGLQLQGRSELTARTDSGTGGNIQLTLGQDDLRMRQNSDINASNISGRGSTIDITLGNGSIRMASASDIVARTVSGQGGNIRFDVSGSIVTTLDQNSDVLADAQSGQGGLIQAQVGGGIFGFRQFQGVVTPESDFTAIAVTGTPGTVEVITRDNLRPADLPEDFLNDALATGCRAQQGLSQPARTTSLFQNLGQGGLPSDLLHPGTLNPQVGLMTLPDLENSEETPPSDRASAPLFQSPAGAQCWVSQN
ncbi:filamentous hemagglutinin N-terminal domain-containing protein [Leptolyngbya sp. CCY15150]|uniref:two-partner secretion domain-containing protein n=1 Tax=Leptolyngbya sp. CCY15150 TaxID=2767772 RepID=UPI0019507778|nr:filamentous hemagglutinin N-terminal domain-containing protein [Leptolyngbya sp. CCY15150]